MEIRKKQTVVITTYSEGQGSPCVFFLFVFFKYPVQREVAENTEREERLRWSPHQPGRTLKEPPKLLKVHQETEDMTKKPNCSSS